MKNYKKIIKKIAKMNGVTPNEVENDMKAAIKYAYENPTLYAKSIPKSGELPEPENVIEYVTKRAKVLK